MLGRAATKIVLPGYRKMMQALRQFQGKDGMWRQLIDHPEAWPETSSTGMFTIAMVGYIDQHADVTNVCAGTNKLNDLNYYLTRPRMTGDFHGQAPVLWSASAPLR
jgi:hypothetical protein